MALTAKTSKATRKRQTVVRQGNNEHDINAAGGECISVL